MGWKGFARAAGRAAVRHQRELEKQQNMVAKMQETERSAYEVQVYQNQALRCFRWLTSSYHEMKSGTGIKKSASRIAKHPIRIGWFGIREDFYFLSYPLEIARNHLFLEND